jgi:hypothetical protein
MAGGAGITLAFLSTAAILLSAFVYIEVRSAHPLLPMRIVLDGNRGGAYFARPLVGVAIFGIFLMGPRAAIATGLVLATAGMVLLTRVGVHTGYWSHVFPAEVVISLGNGLHVRAAVEYRADRRRRA